MVEPFKGKSQSSGAFHVETIRAKALLINFATASFAMRKFCLVEILQKANFGARNFALRKFLSLCYCNELLYITI